MKYSFVLPAYKAAYLKEAIDSILNQTYKEFELIIVNDASPEGVDAIVRSYDDPRIQYYVNAENIGGKDLVAQWNYSITYAKGTYLILASDDDVAWVVRADGGVFSPHRRFRIRPMNNHYLSIEDSPGFNHLHERNTVV